MLDRLRKFAIKMKMSKCKFTEREIQYLGFVAIVGTSEIKVDSNKIKGIEGMRPT